MLIRNKNLCESPKKRCTPRDPAAPRASKPGSVNMKAAKEILRENYAEDVNGRLRAPGFITTLKGVTGRTQADKIANLRRVLATCRRARIPLLKVNGSGFKSYRTLVSQCAVRMTQPVPNIFSEHLGGTTQQRAVKNFLLGRKAKQAGQPKTNANTLDEGVKRVGEDGFTWKTYGNPPDRKWALMGMVNETLADANKALEVVNKSASKPEIKNAAEVAVRSADNALLTLENNPTNPGLNDAATEAVGIAVEAVKQASKTLSPATVAILKSKLSKLKKNREIVIEEMVSGIMGRVIANNEPVGIAVEAVKQASKTLSPATVAILKSKLSKLKNNREIVIKEMVSGIMGRVIANNEPVFDFGRRLRFGNRRYGFGNRRYGFGNNRYMYY
jgi:mRNA-degrading endonuclease RelE of RelBE toxin-antitoxin system